MAWTSPATLNLTEGIDNLFYWLNDVTNFWFGHMIIIAVYLIFLFGYLRSRPEDYAGASAVASYVTFAIGIFFWIMGIISGYAIGIIIGISAISSVALFLQKKVY